MPSANATPASAPNCASRLSISCRNSGVFSRVSTPRRLRPALNCVRWQSSARALALVVLGHVDDKRRRRRVVDEVVADPLRLPRVLGAVRREPAQAAAERRASVSTSLAAPMIRVPIGPVRQRDRARPALPDEPDGVGDLRVGSCRSADRASAGSRARPRRAPARAASASRSAAPRACRCCPSRRASGRRDRRDRRAPHGRATVPPRPISMSSGCGPKARRSTGWSLSNPNFQLPTPKTTPNRQLPNQRPNQISNWSVGRWECLGSWELGVGS